MPDLQNQPLAANGHPAPAALAPDQAAGDAAIQRPKAVRSARTVQETVQTKWTAAVVIVIGVAFIWFMNETFIKSKPTLAFVATIAMLVVALVFIGLGINGRFAGVLIDNRNRISLSKFQMVMWTVLVIAGLVVIASHNLAFGADQPLDLTIPTELLAAMGISAASFVASPVVLSLKADQTPTAPDATAAVAKAQADGTNASFAGKIFGRSNPSGAAWSDMLVGEEVGNCAAPDLGKIQQLFISILLVGVYGFSVKDNLLKVGEKSITAFPNLSQSFVWLMAVSHASYLAYKASPHTSDGTSTTGQSDPNAAG